MLPAQWHISAGTAAFVPGTMYYPKTGNHAFDVLTLEDNIAIAYQLKYSVPDTPQYLNFDEVKSNYYNLEKSLFPPADGILCAVLTSIFSHNFFFFFLLPQM